MIAYKLLRVRKNGTIGSLFIDRRAVLPIGAWVKAKRHPTEGFTVRKGWHALPQAYAPHLSTRGRRWYKVELDVWSAEPRPVSQGGQWYIGQFMRILEAV